MRTPLRRWCARYTAPVGHKHSTYHLVDEAIGESMCVVTIGWTDDSKGFRIASIDMEPDAPASVREALAKLSRMSPGDVVAPPDSAEADAEILGAAGCGSGLPSQGRPRLRAHRRRRVRCRRVSLAAPFHRLGRHAQDLAELDMRYLGFVSFGSFCAGRMAGGVVTMVSLSLLHSAACSLSGDVLGRISVLDVVLPEAHMVTSRQRPLARRGQCPCPPPDSLASPALAHGS